MTEADGNLSSGKGQANICGRVKLVKGILTLPSCQLDLHLSKRYKQTIKKIHKFTLTSRPYRNDDNTNMFDL